MTPQPDNFLPIAQRLADEAGLIARSYFGTVLDILTKTDDSPVTIADRTIELKLRELIERERPDDGIVGEEFGNKDSKSGFTWVFDPIDGTKSFTIARPTFGTLIGLCYEDRPVLGLIDQPILNQRWVGLSGHQTTFNGKPVSCRPCPEIKHAIIGTGSDTQICHDDPARLSRIKDVCRYIVLQGDCYFYGLMANGFIDGLIEDHLGIYDFIALVPVIEGAGGRITDWTGRPKTLYGDTTLVAAGSPHIHTALLELI